MYRIKEDQEHTLEIQKSKFICYLHKTLDETSAKQFIHMIQKKHPRANHYCYGFLIGEQNEIQRSNDDGEPSGTAGVPILECLRKQQLQDITAVVVRYFGGIKLGGGGLLRAYSRSVSETLKNATFTQIQKMKKYQITFSYDVGDKLDYYFRTHAITILQKDYQEMITYIILINETIDKDLQELTNGQCHSTFIEEILMDIDI